jgi:hypothetical protein
MGCVRLMQLSPELGQDEITDVNLESISIMHYHTFISVCYAWDHMPIERVVSSVVS